jgi:glycosyltransferase involved in cell wall biosynthesis
VYNTPEELLREAIDSVLAQTYSSWELCIADDYSTQPHVRRVLETYAQRDPRIKVAFRQENGNISRASNTALDLASGEWVALLDHDDELAPHALFSVVEALNLNPRAKLIYSDEDKIDSKGQRCTPYFKTDWNYDLFLSQNMICHLAVYRRDRVCALGGFRAGYEGAQDYDLALRYVTDLPPEQIVHVPKILYHWRIHPGSTASSACAKTYATDAAARAIKDHLKERGVKAIVERAPDAPDLHRIRYPLDKKRCHTTIIIPTRNGVALLKKCVESIFEKTDHPSYDLIIVDNGSSDPETLDYLEAVPRNASVPVTVLRDPRPFNYAALNNAAVATARGEFVTLLNNDVQILSREWLREMVSHAQRPGVGCVGARLWYPDMTLQHAGVVLGVGGVAGHSQKNLPKGHAGYFGRAVLISQYSAVTAACLTIATSVYKAVGGLDETLKVAFNDIDFCLRVYERGYKNIWTPYAELLHFESKTRGPENTPEKVARFAAECGLMQQRWSEKLLCDPAYNPNLTLEREDFGLAFPPRVTSSWRAREFSAAI